MKSTQQRSRSRRSIRASRLQFGTILPKITRPTKVKVVDKGSNVVDTGSDVVEIGSDVVGTGSTASSSGYCGQMTKPIPAICGVILLPGSLLRVRVRSVAVICMHA